MNIFQKIRFWSACRKIPKEYVRSHKEIRALKKMRNIERKRARKYYTKIKKKQNET